MSMSADDLNGMTIDQVLRRWPQTAQVFRHHSLDCLGCSIAPFCDVTAMADIYGLPKEQFMADLLAAIETEEDADSN